MGATSLITGGCQCGACRYVVAALDPNGYWCHCTMCQRATGGVAGAFVNARKADVEWTGSPSYFMSSPFGRRGFCSACGTPLTFDYADSDKIDLTVGSLDDPRLTRLNSHFGVETRVPNWIVPDDRDEVRCADYAPLVARWAAL